MSALGKPAVGPGASTVEDIGGSCISPLALPDRSQGCLRGHVHSAPHQPTVVATAPETLQAICHKRWKGPREEDRAEIAEDEVKTSDDTWLPDMSGRKGHAQCDRGYMCDHAFSPSTAPQLACGKMSDAAHPPPPARACGIRGCKEGACAPEYNAELGLWTNRCKRTGINTDGSSRPSWHHAWWDEQRKIWNWTCRRGLGGRSSRSQAIVSIEVTEPTIPIQNCMPSEHILNDCRYVKRTPPGAPATLFAQEDVTPEKTSAMSGASGWTGHIHGGGRWRQLHLTTEQSLM